MAMNPGTRMMVISRMTGGSGSRGFDGTGRSHERQDPWNMPGREFQNESNMRYGGSENRYRSEARYRMGGYESNAENRTGGYEGKGYGNRYEMPENRRRGSNGRFVRGEGGGGSEARMIGYDREDDDEPQMHYRHEGSGKQHYSSGMMQQHGKAEHKQDEYREVDEQMAMGWTKRMQNADGSQGARYKPDQVEQWRLTHCMDCDKWELYVAVNMMYSDYSEVAKHMGVDKFEFYCELAKAFLCDEDAGPYKLQKYMQKIAK